MVQVVEGLEGNPKLVLEVRQKIEYRKEWKV
jgi:hypothetical protein